jgi:hypothetical protein
MLDKELFKSYSDGINREATHAYSMFWGDGPASTEYWDGLLNEIREDKPDYETEYKKKHKKTKETEKPVDPAFTDDRFINLED